MGEDVEGWENWPEVIGGVFIPLIQLTWTLLVLVLQGVWWLIKYLTRH